MADIKIVTDLLLVNAIRELASPMLATDNSLSREWLMDHNWIAVPVESGFEDLEERSRRFERAMATQSARQVFAVLTENVADTIGCYLVNTDWNSLLTFFQESSAFTYIVLTKDRSFAVLFSHLDHYVVAGNRNFVGGVLRTSVDEARQQFREYIKVEKPSKLYNALSKFEEDYRGGGEPPSLNSNKTLPQ